MESLKISSSMLPSPDGHGEAKEEGGVADPVDEPKKSKS